MKEQEPNHSEEQIVLEAFHKEVEPFIANKSRTISSAFRIRISDLTIEDARIWFAIKYKSLTKVDLEKYMRTIDALPKGLVKTSRTEFLTLISDKATLEVNKIDAK